MSNFTGATYTLDTTGEVIATGEGGNASSPNEALVKVTSGTALIGGESADALFPLTVDDGIIPVNLKAGDELYAKGSGGAATVKVFRTQGY